MFDFSRRSQVAKQTWDKSGLRVHLTTYLPRRGEQRECKANTHCWGKCHCTAGLQFSSLDSAASLHTETTTFLCWSSPVLLNWRTAVQWSSPQRWVFSLIGFTSGSLQLLRDVQLYFLNCPELVMTMSARGWPSSAPYSAANVSINLNDVSSKTRPKTTFLPSSWDQYYKTDFAVTQLL